MLKGTESLLDKEELKDVLILGLKKILKKFKILRHLKAFIIRKKNIVCGFSEDLKLMKSKELLSRIMHIHIFKIYIKCLKPI